MPRCPWPSSDDEYFITTPAMIVLPDGRKIECPKGIPFEGFGTTPGVWGHFVGEDHDDDSPNWDSLVTWRVSPEEPRPYVQLSN